ncbi:MAG: hypothetical protein ABSF79_03920 [Smithellaceae bacterium]|jgi:hypothetical protein
MILFERWKKTAIHNKALVLTGFLVAFGTLFYAGAAVFQYCLMKDTAKAAAEQTKILIGEMQNQTKAMQDAANATMNTVKVAERNIKSTQEQFRLDQRAWISITKANFREPLDAKKKAVIDFVVKNSGKTPALHLRGSYETWYQHLGTASLKVGKTISGEIAYGPGDEKVTFIGWDEPLLQAQIDLMQSGQEILFIEIKFIYFDIYNSKIPHHTCTCFFYDSKAAINGALSLCETGCSYMD